MIFHFLLQAFVFTSVATSETPHDALQPPAVVSAASTEGEFIAVEGYDPVTDLTFSHSLPAVGENGFGPQRKASDSLGILTTAESALVIDRRTSKVLFEKQAEQKRSIASITKLMTASVLLDRQIDFQDEVIVSPLDRIDGGRIWVYSGERLTVQDLWMTALIASDNVAISALVRHSGLSKEAFVERMNTLAAELGMANSSFTDPTGISRYNVSTANDVALLLDYALSQPQIADAVRRSTYAFSPLNKESVRTIESTNALLGGYLNEDPYRILGGKTGFTYEAGYCLGLVVDGPFANDDVIVVVLGADSIDARFQEVKGLVDWTFDEFTW